MSRATQYRMIGRQSTLPVFEDALHVDQGTQVVFGKHFDLVDFVRRAEPVEEMQKRNTGFESGRMRDQSHVHGFLDGV